MSDANKLATVLGAFLARLDNDSLRKILDAKEDWAYASMNLGDSSQNIAMKKFDTVIADSIESMFYHDQDIVESIIKREFN